MSDAQTRKTKLSAHLLRAISVEAPADPRTVRKLLAGKLVAPMTRERIERALRERGLAHLFVRPDGEQP